MTDDRYNPYDAYPPHRDENPQPQPQQPYPPQQQPQPQQPYPPQQQPHLQQPYPPQQQVPQPQRPQNPGLPDGAFPRPGMTPPPPPVPPRPPKPKFEVKAGEIVALMVAVVAVFSLFSQYIYVRLLGMVLGLISTIAVVLTSRNKLSGISIATLVIGIGAAGISLILTLNALIAIGLYS